MVVAQHTFEVTLRQPFEVTAYSRSDRGTDGSVAYITADNIGNLDCIKGSTYRVAPVTVTTVNAVSANVQYYLKNAPPGFFLDSGNAEILAGKSNGFGFHRESAREH